MSNENKCDVSKDGRHVAVLNVELLEEMAHRHVHPNPHRIPLKCFGCGQTVELTTHVFGNDALEWSGINQPILEARAGDTEDEVLTQIALQMGYPRDWDKDDAVRIMGRLGVIIARVRPNPVSVKTGTGDAYLAAMRKEGFYIDPEWIPSEHYSHDGLLIPKD